MSEKPFGDFAADLRSAQGYSQQKLADLSGFSVATIQNIEAEKGVKPETLDRIYRQFLKIDDQQWQKLLILWLNSELVSKVPTERLQAAFSNFKAAEGSRRPRFLARLEKALNAFTDDELVDVVRYIELMGSDRQWLNNARGLLGIHHSPPPVDIVTEEPQAESTKPVRYSARKHRE